MIEIRHETQQDIAAVRGVNEEAFEGPAEAKLVDALRIRDALTLSLVALHAAGIQVALPRLYS